MMIMKQDKKKSNLLYKKKMQMSSPNGFNKKI